MRILGIPATAWLSVTALLLGSFALSCAAEPEPQLAGTSWNLTTMELSDDLRDVSQADPVTIEFSSDGNLNGITGCNAYSGTYDLNGSAFRIEEFRITEASCLVPELNEREANYTRILIVATSASVVDDKLLIADQDGQTLTFKAKSP